MKVNFIVPAFPMRSVGGYKIMYQYANLFAKHGYDVMIYHVASFKDVAYKHPSILRYLKNNVVYRNQSPKWFDFDDSIRFKSIGKVTDETVRDADACISTMYATAIAISKLSSSKGKKINLIQDYELWIAGGNVEVLNESYKLPIRHVVIADYLQKKVFEVSGIIPTLIYNAIDTDKFRLDNDISSRGQYTVSMLYSQEERKGTQYGLEALRICHEQCPQLRVELFGVFPDPKLNEDWIKYHRSPNDLCGLYNSTAIYFTPSNGEGWALPPAEAMNCGCALVCTAIDGHAAYALDEMTCLTVEPRNPQHMASQLMRLLTDNGMRVRLANNGREYVRKFDWNMSFGQMESIVKGS